MTTQDMPRRLRQRIQDLGAAYGAVMITPEDSWAKPLLACSKQFDHVGTRTPATQLLLISRDDGSWSASPRCDQHPAEDDLTIVRKVMPLAACIVLKVLDPSGMAVHLPGDQAASPPKVFCTGCHSEHFVLQLGGRRSGEIQCQSCGLPIDAGAAAGCPGCGAELELAPVVNHRDGCPAQL